MPRSLDEMVSSGQAKMTRKAAQMTSSYNAAKPRMKTAYGTTPFGPTRKANYNAAIDAATHRVDPAKWATNWRAKMAE